ncbi:hypothetical protein [Brevundimonas sp.]
MKRLVGLAVLVATMAAGSVATAQVYSMEPNFGTTRLSAGFAPDPHRIPVTAGGDVDVSSTMQCVGWISNRPDVRINYTPGSFPITFRVESEGGTTLIVRTPDDRWLCDFDAVAGKGPEVKFNQPIRGDYNVWIGTFDRENVDATLLVTKSDAGSSAASGGTAIDASLTAAEEVALEAGRFTQVQVNATAGGGIAASTVSANCPGKVSAAPTYQITYSPGNRPLIVRSHGFADTTLLIRSPDGQWHCDDDGYQGVDAQLRFDQPTAGDYDIWVGTHGDEMDRATLVISEQPGRP